MKKAKICCRRRMQRSSYSEQCILKHWYFLSPKTVCFSDYFEALLRWRKIYTNFSFHSFFCSPVHLFIAPYFSIATSLRCYKCYSDTSWNRCDDDREIVTCPEEHEEACSKVFYNHELHGRETHTKFCEKKSQCTKTSNPVCKAAKAHKAQCEVHCCTHDLCNASSATAVSVILLVACTVLLVVSLSLEKDFNHEGTRIGNLLEAQFEYY